MTDLFEDQIRAALTADADAAPLPLGLAARARSRAQRRRRWAFGASAAGVVAVGAAAVVLATVLPGSPAPAPVAAPAPSSSPSVGPTGPLPGDPMASCASVDAQFAAATLAFDGTITAVTPLGSDSVAPSGYRVTFAVNDWLRGGTGPDATVRMGYYFGEQLDVASDDPAPYDVGQRMLVSGADDPVTGEAQAWTACGGTWYWDPQTARDWQAGFAK